MASTGEIFRATVNYAAPGSSAVQNVFHWQYAGASTANDNVGDAIETWLNNEWGPRWAGISSSDYELVDVDIIRVNPDGTVQSDLGTRMINITGVGAADMMSAAVSSWMGADTAKPKQRGSKYVPGISEDQVVNGLLIASTLVELALLLVDWLLELDVASVGTLTPGLRSSTLVAFEPFLDAGSITDVPAYQRRRKPNVGA